jgi:hypothetical protein
LAASTASTVGSELMTRDTVFRLTPASAATSRIVARPGGGPAGSPAGGIAGAGGVMGWSGVTAGNDIRSH